MLLSLKEEVNRERITKSKIQMELSKKEERAASMKKAHFNERRRLLDECRQLFQQLEENRSFLIEKPL
jgi:predicted ATPase